MRTQKPTLWQISQEIITALLTCSRRSRRRAKDMRPLLCRARMRNNSFVKSINLSLLFQPWRKLDQLSHNSLSSVKREKRFRLTWILLENSLTTKTTKSMKSRNLLKLLETTKHKSENLHPSFPRSLTKPTKSYLIFTRPRIK